LLYAIDTYSYSKYSKKYSKIKITEKKGLEKPDKSNENINPSTEKTGGETIYKGLYRNIE